MPCWAWWERGEVKYNVVGNQIWFNLDPRDAGSFKNVQFKPYPILT